MGFSLGELIPTIGTWEIKAIANIKEAKVFFKKSFIISIIREAITVKLVVIQIDQLDIR